MSGSVQRLFFFLLNLSPWSNSKGLKNGTRQSLILKMHEHKQIRTYSLRCSTLRPVSRSCEKRLLVSSYQYVGPSSAWNNSAPNGHVFMKFDISVFFKELLSKLKFH